jgi:hypothetical protein
MDTLSLSGVWWLPERPDNQQVGVFTTADGAWPTLTLYGDFRELPDQSVFQPDIILGLTQDSQHVTLCRCTEVSRRVSFTGGPPSSVLHAAVVIRGRLFPQLSDIRFSRVSLYLEHLGEWSEHQGLAQQALFDEEDKFLKSTLTLLRRDPIICTAGTTEVAIGYDGSMEGMADTVRKGFVLRHWIRLKPPEPVDLSSAFAKLLYPARTFVALGLAWPTQPLRISAWAPDSDDSLELLHFLEPSRLAAKPPDLHQDRAFSLPDIRAGLAEHFARWLALPERLEPVRALYFSVLYAKAMYLEHQFLNLIQALETLQRETLAASPIGAERWMPVRDALGQVIDDPQFVLTAEERELLRRRLERFADDSLRSRLRAFMASVQPHAAVVVPDGKQFVHRVVNARNFHTHHDPSAASSTRDSRAVVIMRDQLSALLELGLLRYLNMPEEVLAALARRRHDSLARIH